MDTPTHSALDTPHSTLEHNDCARLLSIVLFPVAEQEWARGRIEAMRRKQWHASTLSLECRGCRMDAAGPCDDCRFAREFWPKLSDHGRKSLALYLDARV